MTKLYRAFDFSGTIVLVSLYLTIFHLIKLILQAFPFMTSLHHIALIKLITCYIIYDMLKGRYIGILYFICMIQRFPKFFFHFSFMTASTNPFNMYHKHAQNKNHNFVLMMMTPNISTLLLFVSIFFLLWNELSHR